MIYFCLYKMPPRGKPVIRKKNEPPKKPKEKKPKNVQPKEEKPKKRNKLPTNYIDVKSQKKELSLHHVALPGTYMMDLMFDGPKSNPHSFLVAINVNTRKVYAVYTRVQIDEKTFEMKSARVLIPALNAIITSIDSDDNPGLNGLREIIMDGEKGMYSEKVRKHLQERKIKIRRVDVKEIHTALSLIDRVIRTLRDMNYRENNGPGRLIDEHIMNHLVEKYNKSVHLGLSRLIGFDVSPNDVHRVKELQMKVMKRLEQKNFLVYTDARFAFNKGNRVAIWDPPKWNVKRRLRVKPDGYIVNELKGGYYELINETNGKKVLYPRWGMKSEIKI